MHNKRFLLTQLMKLSFQILLYGLLFFSFFSILSITNPQIINLSRTAATTMATFAVIMAILTFVYGGYDIGDKKVRSVFSSILISTLFADVITYLQLQIMNVNPANNDHLILWGEDLALLGIVVVLQVGLIYFLVSMGYHFFFKINPPQDCCIITSSQELAIHVAEKIASFRRKFKLCDVVHYECDDIQDTIKKHDIIFLAGIPDTEEGQLQNFCYGLNKTIYLLAELEDVVISTAHQNILDDTPFLYIHRVEPTLVQRFTKRTSDIVISLLGLILTSPVMLIAALCIFFSSNGPVFFKQSRATIHGKVFQIIKFRTMYVEEDEGAAKQVSASENDHRITPLGRVLRKYRIDELPQLYNVLRGDMSMVGPRPEMLENVEKYEQEVPEFKYRQQMKAGLTGLAQIDGKYNTAPKDKAILDLLYIENFSIPMDIKLILRTLTIFFRRDSTEGFAASPKTVCPKMRTEALHTEQSTPATPATPVTPASPPADQSSFVPSAVKLASAASKPIGLTPVPAQNQQPDDALQAPQEETIRAAL